MVFPSCFQSMVTVIAIDHSYDRDWLGANSWHSITRKAVASPGTALLLPHHSKFELRILLTPLAAAAAVKGVMNGRSIPSLPNQVSRLSPGSAGCG